MRAARQVRRTSLPAAAAILTLLATTACGGSGGDDATTKSSTSPTSSAVTTPTAAPANGSTVKGTGYTYRLPEGWDDITAEFKAANPSIDTGARQHDRVVPYTPNLNVVTSASTIKGTPTESDLASLDKLMMKEVASTAPNLKSLDRIKVDGATAIHQEGKAKEGTTKYFLVQYLAVHDGHNYGFTFGFPRKTDAAARAKITDAVLASFRFS